MPGIGNSTPAQWVGGQRRKLVRRNCSNTGPPRSNTMPVLNPGSAAASLVSSVNTVGSGYAKARPSEDSLDQHSAGNRMDTKGCEGKMQSHSVSEQAVKSGPQFTSIDEGPLLTSESKKKHSFFHSMKPKKLERPKNISEPILTSPLPLSTPTKAARFFGLETKATAASSPRRIEVHDDGYSHDEVVATVRPALKKQYSLPLLTRLKLGTDKQTRSKQECAEPGSAKFVGASRATATETCSGSEGLQQPQVRVPAAPRPIPKHQMRRKNPKSLQRMSPITEASIESLRPIYCDGEEVTELGVITEYDHDDMLYSTEDVQDFKSLHDLVTHVDGSWPNIGAFELDEADLSPSDNLYDESVSREGKVHVVHPGTGVDFKRACKGRQVPIRSPLQTFEHAYLDATEEEMWLEAHQQKLAQIEADRRAIDIEIEGLRREHERLRLGLGDITANANESMQSSSDDGDDDAASLNSSIDLDEEPTVHEAKVMTFTRITPGTVKLIDIPPKKKEPVSNTANDGVSVTDKLSHTEHARKAMTVAAYAENTVPVSPLVTHYHHEDPDSTAIPKKSKWTRDESRLLVQNWISDYHSTEQRPISTRIDPDVLADQETPPAPFPKSDEGLLTPPIKARNDSLKSPKSLPKHQCINNGHIFHPIDLKTIPDDAVVNSLEVRPYLQTYTGIKQHVKIVVLCEKCGKDCDENIWECEIAVCRMAVCQPCAEKMEAEWQERAANGWKYK